MASSGLAAPLVSPMASIGVPREIKRDEQRVALTPDGVRELVSQGMEVRIEAGAGHGVGISDDDYGASGARLVSREDAWAARRPAISLIGASKGRLPSSSCTVS